MKKIITISDNPLGTSGVARQTRMAIEAFLDSGDYEVVSLAASIEHEDYSPYITEKYKNQWKIFPMKGFSDLELIRSLIKTERPDLMWLMTDPRFFETLWGLDAEIRAVMPILYYHVWDNYPYPVFNNKYYQSNDIVVCISKLTKDVLEKVSPEVKSVYLPHTVDTTVFRNQQFSEVEYFLAANNISYEGKKIFFWNNRNGVRKHATTLLWWFKKLLDDVGHDKAMLIMHTDPKDSQGSDLITNLEHLELTSGQVFVSNEKVPDRMLATFYNIADCTINIAHAEGFGLSSLESMACGTPVISTMTGGLKDQIFDGSNWYGIGIEPSSKMLVGSQKVPYVFEDRISCEDFIAACKKIINMPKEDIVAWGRECRNNVIKNFNYNNYKKQWIMIAEEVIRDNGSWDMRENFDSWRMAQV